MRHQPNLFETLFAGDSAFDTPACRTPSARIASGGPTPLRRLDGRPGVIDEARRVRNLGLADIAHNSAKHEGICNGMMPALYSQSWPHDRGEQLWRPF